MTNSSESNSLQTKLDSSTIEQKQVLVKQKLQTMLKIQDGLNQRVNPDWKNAGYPWRDAMMVEAVELFDHLNWKWWKKNAAEIDWGQVQMEAVDIWHFILSEVIQEEEIRTINLVAKNMVTSYIVPRKSASDAKDRVKEFLAAAITPDKFLIAYFRRVLDETGLDFDTLYKLYVGKAKLNELRWANGYGTTYLKNWLGEEDNQFLTKLISRLDINDPRFPEQVILGLETRYKVITEFTEKEPV